MTSKTTAMTLGSMIRSNSMNKVHVTEIRKKRDEEPTERRSEVYVDDVACLYRDRNGVFILKKGGILMKVNHTLEELKPYFFGDMTPRERLS